MTSSVFALRALVVASGRARNLPVSLASGPGGRLELLGMPDVVEAARRLAIGLMRKGRGMMAKYHDEGLADEVLGVLLGSGNPYSGGKTPHRG